jgi:plastocyanin
MLRAFARTLAVGVTAAALFACGSDSTAPAPSSATVTADTLYKYTPDTVTVSRASGSATVTWAFQHVHHTVTWTSQPSGAAVAEIPTTQDASVARDFSVAGVYLYQCALHSSMHGAVIVQ